MRTVPGVVALAAATFLAAASAPPPFVEELPSLQAGVDANGAALFLPLDPSFSRCLPLPAVCPDDATGLVLARADHAAIRWAIEEARVNEVAVDLGAVEPIGAPPADPAASTFLVPVLDGAGVFLLHAPTRLTEGGLTPALPGPAPDGTRVTPVLDDLPVPSASPSPRAPNAIVREPRLVESDELVGATPALLVRRSAPHRVVFGVRPDPAWRLAVSVGYLPLIGPDGVAVVARSGSEVGLAVPAPQALVADSGGSDGSAPDVPWLAAVAAVLGAAATLLVARRKRHGPTVRAESLAMPRRASSPGR